MPAKSKIKNPSALPNEVPVIFNEPVEMPSVYATNITAQVTEYEVILSFYEAQYPLNLAIPIEQQKADLASNGIRADCVGKIVISRGRFETIVKVIQDLTVEIKKQTSLNAK